MARDSWPEFASVFVAGSTETLVSSTYIDQVSEVCRSGAIHDCVRAETHVPHFDAPLRWQIWQRVDQTWNCFARSLGTGKSRGFLYCLRYIYQNKRFRFDEFAAETWQADPSAQCSELWKLRELAVWSNSKVRLICIQS